MQYFAVFLVSIFSCSVVQGAVTLYVDTSFCLTSTNPRYFTTDNFQCLRDPFDPAASMMVNCSSTKGSSPWTFTRFANSTTCTNATVTQLTSLGVGCLSLGNMAVRVDCTGLPTAQGTMCRSSDVNGCRALSTYDACRNQGTDFPCAWCFSQGVCYYSPPLKPCFFMSQDGTTSQYLAGANSCPATNICNVNKSMECLALTKDTCTTRSTCQFCTNISPAYCAFNPPTQCNYLGNGNTFPNYCPLFVPAYIPCADNERNEASAWCQQKESAEECDFSDDNVYPCKWCSTLGGAPRCMWTPVKSCSYYEPTYGITIIYGGISTDGTGGQCAVIGGTLGVASLVSGWSVTFMFVAILLAR